MTLASPNSCSSDGYFSDVFDCIGEVCVCNCVCMHTYRHTHTQIWDSQIPLVSTIYSLLYYRIPHKRCPSASQAYLLHQCPRMTVIRFVCVCVCVCVGFVYVYLWLMTLLHSLFIRVQYQEEAL